MPRQRSTQSGSDRGLQSDPTTVQDQGQSGGQGQGGGTVEQARGKATQLASEAQQKASEQVKSGASRGKDQAAQTLSGVAQSLRLSSQQLREQDQAGVSRYAEQAADQVERLSNYLQNTDVNEIVDRIEELARRQPAVFLGGAFTLGLLGARFLKSSRRRESQATGAGYYGTPGPTGGTYRSDRDVAGLQGAGGLAPERDWATPAVGAAAPIEPARPVEPGFAPPLADISITPSPPGPEGTERF